MCALDTAVGCPPAGAALKLFINFKTKFSFLTFETAAKELKFVISYVNTCDGLGLLFTQNDLTAY